MHETMKKTMLFAALAAVLALVSCNKEQQALPQEKVTKTVTFNAVVPQTKALFSTPDGSNYPVLWTANDTKVDLLVNYDYNHKVQPDITRSADDKSITFSADIETGGDAYTFVAVSPANSVISANNTDKRFGITVPTSQTPTATSPDEKAILLYAKSDDFDAFQSDVNMDFQHVTGYLHIQFTNYATALAGATVSSVTVTSTSEKVLAGRIFFFPGDGHMEENGTSGSATVSVATSSLDDVWIAVAPVDLSNETLEFVIGTDKGTITKRIQCPASAVLGSGKIAKFPISLSGSTIKAPIQYNLVTNENQLHVGDKVIIVAANDDFALSSTQNTNNRGTAGIIKGDGVILDPSDAVEVIELEDGYKPGEYALKATKEGGYLYAAYEESGGNHMKTKATLDEYGSWSISVADKQNGTGDTDSDEFTKNVATIHAASSGRGLMLFNKTSSLFSAYGTGSSLLVSKVSYLHIYRLNEAADDSPRFKATMPDADGENNIATSSYAKDDIEVYVFGNSAWTASVTGEGAALSSTSGSGNSILTLSIPENTSESSTKEYTVIVSTTAGVVPASYTFTITQAKKPGEGGIKIGDVLWSETWAGGTAGNTPSAYQASGNATTTVYGGASVTYTEKTTGTKLYDDGLVYVPTGYSGGLDLPSNMNNLMIAKSGWWKIAGVPCPGVKSATITYRINRSGTKYTATSATTGVTIGARGSATSTSEWGKTVYIITYPITFEAGTESFDIQLNNTDSSNNLRVSDIDIIVTDVY